MLQAPGPHRLNHLCFEELIIDMILPQFAEPLPGSHSFMHGPRCPDGRYLQMNSAGYLGFGLRVLFLGFQAFGMGSEGFGFSAWRVGCRGLHFPCEGG